MRNIKSVDERNFPTFSLATKKFMSFCAKVLKDQRSLAVRPGNCVELRVAKTAKTTDALLKIRYKIILPHTY